MPKTPVIVNKFLAAASSLLARSRLSTAAGMTYEGDRDLFKALGYKRELLFADYAGRYARGDIAARIINIFPAATWRLPPELKEGDDPTEFTEAWEALAIKFHLFHSIERLDRITGVGRYGVLLLGVNDTKTLDQPLTPVKGPEDLLYIQPYAEGHAVVHEFDTNTSSRRFGLPSMYQIDTSGNMLAEGKQQLVHWTRIIHVAEGLTFNNIYGEPRLKNIWNRLDDFDKVIGGASEATWRTVYGGIQFDIDKDAELKPEDIEALDDELQAYVHGFQRFIRTQGVKTNVLGSDVPDPRGPFEVISSIIAGTKGIPQRILFGSERGQLASLQDERNFNARVMERQSSFAEPVILRPIIDTFSALNILPEPKEAYSIEWPDLNRLSQRELADIAARYGQAIRNVSSQETAYITPDEFRDIFLRLPPLTDAEAKKTEPDKDEPKPGFPEKGETA